MALVSAKVTTASQVAGGGQSIPSALKSVKVNAPGPINVTATSIGPPGPQGPPGGTWRGAWSSGTTYALNDVAQGSNGHYYYSVQNGNLNHNPTTDTTQTWWVDSLPASVANVSRYLTPSGGNDQPSLQAGLSLSTPRVLLAPGTFQVPNADLTVPSFSVLEGAGMDRTTLSIGDVANANGGVGINGTDGGFYPLTANLLERQTTITVSVANAANFAAGQLIRISDTTLQTGWVTAVVSVNGGTGVITLEEPSPTTARTANSAFVCIITPVYQITLRDLTIALTPAGSPALTSILKLTDFYNVRLERVRFKLLGANPMVASSFVLQATYGRDLKLIDCETENITAQTPLGSGTNLGLSATCVTAGHYRGNKCRNSQCGLVLTGSPQSVIVGNHMFGRPDALGRGIKTLNGSNYSTVEANVIGGYSATPTLTTDRALTGIHVLDSGHVSVVGNQVADCGGVGIVCAPSVASGANNLTHHNKINSNEVSNCGFLAYPVATPFVAGIQLGDSAIGIGDSGQHTCNANTLDDTGGIYIWHSDSKITENLLVNNPWGATPDIYIRANGAVRNEIARNKITNSSTTTVIDTSANSTSPGNLILDNDIDATATINPAGFPYDPGRGRTRTVQLTDGATINIDAAKGTQFWVQVNGSRTIASPTHALDGQEIVIEIQNATGGAVVTTWAAGYKLAGAWVDPAASKWRTVRFMFNAAASLWYETTRTAADAS
jgi:hypothetical protein